MKKRSKRFQKILKSKIKDKKIELKEAIDFVKKNSTTKFDESIDVSLRLNLKQSKGGDLSLRTIVKLPNGSGKKYKLAVLCEQKKIDGKIMKIGKPSPNSRERVVFAHYKNIFGQTVYKFYGVYETDLGASSENQHIHKRIKTRLNLKDYV